MTCGSILCEEVCIPLRLLSILYRLRICLSVSPRDNFNSGAHLKDKTAVIFLAVSLRRRLKHRENNGN